MGLARRLSGLAMAAILLGAAAGPASAATTEIGAASEIRAGTAPDPGTAALGPFYTVQIAEASGTYAVPAGYGVITRWSHRTGQTGGDLTFKVYRPTGSPGQFLVLAADPRTVTAGTVHNFGVRIPVRPGDRIGISTDTVEVGYRRGTAADQVGAFDFAEPDPPPGTTAILDGPPYRDLMLDVAARVETDADRDGFGDDTQDRCPTSAATQGSCPISRPAPLPGFTDCPASVASVIRGTVTANTLTGTARADRIFAGTGNDVVDGLAGDDCIDLGPGTDRGQGGDGGDLLVGGLGRDRMSGNLGADRLRGGSSPDRLNGGFGNDTLHGQSGSDRVSGERGRDRINGGSSNDVIAAGSSGDRVAGDQGNDRINGNSGNDSLKGNSGRDRISGGSGLDRISGGSGSDRISARDGRRDRISCGTGRDTVSADRDDRVGRDCERVVR